MSLLRFEKCKSITFGKSLISHHDRMWGQYGHHGKPVYTIGYGNDVDSGLLKDLSLINEAASMSAMDEDVVYKIGSLLNAEM
jgi:hypothetical protein